MAFSSLVGCTDILTQTERNLVAIQEVTDEQVVIPICQSILQDIGQVEIRFTNTVQAMTAQKHRITNALEKNRVSFSDIQSNINRKNDEVDRLQCELSAEQATAAEYNQRITQLEADIHRKEAQKREKERKARNVSIGMAVVSVFTFGAGAVVGGVSVAATTALILVMANDIDNIKGQVHDLRNRRNETQRQVSATQTRIHAVNRERTELIKSKIGLVNEKHRLDEELKKLGRYDVYIGRGIVSVAQAKNKCEFMINAIENVKELASDGLLECVDIRESVTSLALTVSATRSNLSQIRMIQF